MRASLSFRGPRWAWAALALLGFLLALQLALAPRQFDDAALETLRASIASSHLREAGLSGRPWDSLSAGERQALSDRAVEGGRIRILALDTRGYGRCVSVRVRFVLEGRESVRYFSMERSALFGWILKQEIPALAYYLTLW